LFKVLIIHNFPDNISALRFEWAWQEPKASRRLKTIQSIQRKKPSESHFTYHFRILTEMINLGPWNRLPLKIRWLEQDFCTQFPTGKLPQHMMICHGAIKAKKKKIGITQSSKDLFEAVRARKECHLCMEEIENLEEDRVFCVNSLQTRFALAMSRKDLSRTRPLRSYSRQLSPLRLQIPLGRCHSQKEGVS
jgi:structure-specific endonuclease subunit SLX1